MIHINNTPIPTYFASNVTFDILVNGKPIKQYDHKSKTYIEGRAKSNYSIRVKNDNYSDVLAVISVDGLSIVDGTPASENSRGWIVKSRSEINIPGWLVDNKSAAKFKFDEKKQSYAEKSEEGDIKNVGVIGCLVYEKKTYNPIFINNFQTFPTWPDPVFPKPMWSGGSGGPLGNGPYYGMNDMSDNYSGSGILRGSAMKGTTCNAAYTSNSMSGLDVEASACGAMAPDKHELGTGFGAKTDFKSGEESFTKGELLKTFVLYYDSKRNLEKLGIIFAKKEKVQSEPSPFPASTKFCKPPKNW